jgi:TetR/AcrR family acrAB operon transcriptional repressor
MWLILHTIKNVCVLRFENIPLFFDVPRPMARRTKAEAEQTRDTILDAAEQLFHAKGVSATSLSDIASLAGVTRGAIYWHFKDKVDVFNAMMERVTLPLEDLVDAAVNNSQGHALASLRSVIAGTMQRVQDDLQFRQVFDITRNRAAYVAEMQPVHERLTRTRDAFLTHTQKALELEAVQQQRTLLLPLQQAALVLHTQVDGIIHNWLMSPQAFDLPQVGLAAFDVAVRGLGLEPPQAS